MVVVVAEDVTTITVAIIVSTTTIINFVSRLIFLTPRLSISNIGMIIITHVLYAF